MTTGAGPATQAQTPRSPILLLLRSSNYRILLGAGCTWYLGIFMWAIVSGWLVLQLTDSAFQTQLVGVMMFAPLPIGGVLSGVLADAFDRRRVLVVDQIASASIIALAAVLLLSGQAQGWHILGLSLALGAIQTVDAACRRTLAFELAPRELVSSALALESVTLTVGAIGGPLLGGLLLDLVPLKGEAVAAGPYTFIMAALLVGAVLLLRIRRGTPQARVPLKPRAAVAATIEGLRAVGSNRAMIGILGVTVIVNLAFFSAMPLIPVFAEKVLHVNPTLMGFLGAAQGLGGLIGSTFIASQTAITKKWAYYTGGSTIGLAFLCVFALSGLYHLSLAALLVAGIGISGFGSMQATLVLLSATEEMRGRAMGVLNMAIGALPLGTLAVGMLVEVVGPQQAVAIATVVGLVSIVLWTYLSKEMRRL